MLMIMTRDGVFQTPETREEIQAKIAENPSEISFLGSSKEVSFKKDTCHSCDEIVTLNLEVTQIYGYREYTNLGEEQKSEELLPHDEAQLLDKEIREKQERKSNLEKAMKDPDYIEYFEKKIEASDALARYVDKTKEK